MHNLMTLVLMGSVGILVGVVFFGGLWWTVQKGLTSKRPALLFVFSFLIRTFIVVVTFVIIMGGEWQRLLACLVGFVIARLMVNRFVKTKSSTHMAHEILHERGGTGHEHHT